jgi:hypothetical protein
MRWAAKAGQEKLEWRILDVEQDEWEQRLADLGVAAAANGFPVYPAAPAAQGVGSLRVPHKARHILAAGVILVVLGSLAGSLAGYSVWRRAQEGITRLQGDVANAVKVESIQGNSLRRGPAQHESVQAVEFLGSAAQATVLVTYTLGAGGLSVQPGLRFYVQTSKGWQRSDPVAGFWGPTETLDTAHLHFVFGRRDKSAVEDVAPGADASYMLMRRATGAAPGLSDLAPIEIVPGYFPFYAQIGDSRLRLTSPSLYTVPVQERAAVLNRILGIKLADQLMATAAQRSPPKAQWQPLVQAFGTWLKFSTGLGRAPEDDVAATQRLLRFPLREAWHLADLQEDVLRYDPAAQTMVVFTLVSDTERQTQRRAAAELLIGYIAGTYGIDALPELLLGFAQYDDWEELAPAVLGVSAAELEEGWHTAMRTEAPARKVD